MCWRFLFCFAFFLVLALDLALISEWDFFLNYSRSIHVINFNIVFSGGFSVSICWYLVSLIQLQHSLKRPVTSFVNIHVVEKEANHRLLEKGVYFLSCKELWSFSATPFDYADLHLRQSRVGEFSWALLRFSGPGTHAHSWERHLRISISRCSATIFSWAQVLQRAALSVGRI